MPCHAACRCLGGHTGSRDENLGLAYKLPYLNFDSSTTVSMQVDQWWHVAEQIDFSNHSGPPGMQNLNLTTWGPFLGWDTHF